MTDNMVVTDGLINKAVVRLRGPETLLRSVTQRKIIQAVDLSSIKRGTTVVPLSAEHLGAKFRAFELIDVQPPRIVVKADTLMERSVPVKAVVDSPLRGGALTVENVSVTPATVVLRGPEAVVSSIANIPLTIMRFDAGDWAEFLTANIYFALQDEELRYDLLKLLKNFVQFH
jgi:UDP-glucose pyrophosphorylase